MGNCNHRKFLPIPITLIFFFLLISSPSKAQGRENESSTSLPQELKNKNDLASENSNSAISKLPTVLNSGELSPSTELPKIVVSGENENLIVVATSATQGVVRNPEIKNRPIARPAELLQAIPGMIITQHAGAGKANQYYLRGFNLDHGTGFAFYLDGVPINLPTHAHGQGYADLNFIIPEMVKEVSYQKGIYYADQGDFNQAGAANIEYYTILPQDFIQLQLGGLGYERGLILSSASLEKGHWIYALEAHHFNGAWETPMNYRRFNGMTKYSAGDKQIGYSISFQGYYGIWLSSEQVPQRAIYQGLINRFSTLDPSTGGNTHRYSLYGDWHKQGDHSHSKIIFYLTQYNLDLFSNFTYWLNQLNGDQIQQKDSRVYTGVRSEHTIFGTLFDRNFQNTFGLQLRDDWIQVTLNQTQNRNQLNHVRTDHVSILNVSPWYENKFHWSEWGRTIIGVRGDLFHFVDKSDTAINSGKKFTGTFSPKWTTIFGPWNKTEFYIQGGLGFRTNDARGIFSKLQPETAEQSRMLPPIVHTQGAEMGIRSMVFSSLNTTVSAWSLWSDSETFFAGDVGATIDTNRPGVRYGIEWTNVFTPCKWLTMDADFAYSWSYFTDNDPQRIGKHIPEAVTSVLSAGSTFQQFPILENAFASLRLRYFGPRPLVEDNSQKSSVSAVFNLLFGYQVNKTWSAYAEILNFFNTQYNDNEYYYSSRLKGEPAGPNEDQGYNDHMIHSGEPRSFRVAVVARF